MLGISTKYQRHLLKIMYKTCHSQNGHLCALKFLGKLYCLKTDHKKI